MSRKSSLAQVLLRISQKSGKSPVKAKGRTKSERGKMNGLESDWAVHLEADPEVIWWKYDACKLRLADDTFYVPDFLVQLRSGELQVHEVKGHWEDDARVKIKVAASIYPFLFVAVRRVDGRWEKEAFG